MAAPKSNRSLLLAGGEDEVVGGASTGSKLRPPN